ncbi:TlpA family protein disulfide reductase [Protaetiibacter larvae]|uniref:Thioredoxin family protein n=1 Tax=Protaetiibacter larvae TaxID=2592654 RepID=A0A5C1Y7N6_9MICO|nr:thioredoxin family protein [Protaetiibacter larvae]QEO09851.1 thioredoxin family protein [Protaetiibacter larvae]
MDPWAVFAVLGALVLASTVLGVVWRSGQGRIRTSTTTDTVAIDGVELGDGVTLLQFSSEYCSPCRATARVLDELATQRHGIVHVELDVAERPELAARFQVLQTPTTFVLDAEGRIRSRIGGAVRRDAVAAELDRLLGAAAA